jgi:hypothetical protein
MQLPKYKKKKREKLKICQEPGCGKEFIGHPIAKYCPDHRNISNRTRKVKIYESVDVKNFVFSHNFTDVTEIERACSLPGCNRRYILKIYPKQKIYPKFCEEHRNDFKRKLFNKIAV